MSYFFDAAKNTLRKAGKFAVGVTYSLDKAAENSGHPLENGFGSFGKFNGKYILYNTFSIFSQFICVIDYIVPGNDFNSVQSSPNTIYKSKDGKTYVIAVKIPENIKQSLETHFPIRKYDMIIVSLKKNPDGTLYKNRNGTYELHNSYTKCDDTICNGDIKYKIIDEAENKFEQIIYNIQDNEEEKYKKIK